MVDALPDHRCASALALSGGDAGDTGALARGTGI